MYEVELKYPLGASAAEVRTALARLGARFRPAVEQCDRYFAHPSRDFARTDEALRLRREGHDVAITWKGPRLGTAGKSRREIELPLAPRDERAPVTATLEAFTELLEALGFHRVREVAKVRLPARLPWHGTEIEVAIDTVAGLGDYLELELLAREGEVPLALESLASLAAELGIRTPERRSYLELLMAVDRPR